jgi:hypothetical protein
MRTELFLSLALVACSNDGTQGSEPTPTATTSNASTGKQEMPSLTCEQLVPSAVRDKHLAGMQIGEEGPLKNYGTTSTMCFFGKDKPNMLANVVSVVIGCTPYYEEPGVKGLEAILAKESKRHPKGAIVEKIAKPGRGGVYTEGTNFADDKRVWFVIEDLPCGVEITSRTWGRAELSALAVEIAAKVK